MKRWLLSLLVILLLFPGTIAFAEESNKPDPNIYEKNQIDYNMNFRDQMRRREQIPQKQQELQFHFKEQNYENDFTDKLTFVPKESKRTVIRKATEAGLFSEDVRIPIEDSDQEAGKGISFMRIIFIIIAVFVVGSLIMIVPRLGQMENETTPVSNR